MQLPCRSLEKVPALSWQSVRPFPVLKSVNTDSKEGKDGDNPGCRFRNDADRRDFPIAVAQIEFRSAGRETGKGKAAQVRALIGGKYEPVGGRASDSVRGAAPVVDDQGEATRSK